MKKFLMTLAVACFALTASAQEKGDFRFGVTAGMNVANVTDCERDSRIGFHVGVKGEYNITENLYGSADRTHRTAPRHQSGSAAARYRQKHP